MVPQGAADAPAPVRHPVRRARQPSYWADERTWVYDLPATCAAGEPLPFRSPCPDSRHWPAKPSAAPEYAFNIIGPVVVWMLPSTGSQSIDEEQAFVLRLNAPVKVDSIEAEPTLRGSGHSGSHGGRHSASSVRHARASWMRPQYSRIRRRRGRRQPGSKSGSPQCARHPARPRPSWHLVWGPGHQHRIGAIAMGRSNASTSRHVITFQRTHELPPGKTPRPAACPLLPLRVEFTAPVPRALLDKISLQDAKGKAYRQRTRRNRPSPVRHSLPSRARSPPVANLTLKLPDALIDDKGRALVNAARFPMTIPDGRHAAPGQVLRRIRHHRTGRRRPAAHHPAQPGSGQPGRHRRQGALDAAGPAMPASWIGKPA
jgi:hypothetical protein